MKKLNNKITNDKIINDNDSYCISIIIKLKNTIPIKDINSKVCSQAYFIDDNKKGLISIK